MLCCGNGWCSYRDPVAYLAVPIVRKLLANHALGLGPNLTCNLLHDIQDGLTDSGDIMEISRYPSNLLPDTIPNCLVLYLLYIL